MWFFFFFFCLYVFFFFFFFFQAEDGIRDTSVTGSSDVCSSDLAEILEKGIQAVTIDSVVARAGSSKGGALYYFHTKDELLYGVLEWLLAEMSRALDEIAEEIGRASCRERV